MGRHSNCNWWAAISRGLQPRKFKILQGKFISTWLWFKIGVAVSFWHLICKNKNRKQSSAIPDRLLTGQMMGSVISHFRQSWTTSFPSNMKMMCGFVLATGHRFFCVTINLIYIMYDKAHGPHYRIQDIQRVVWRTLQTYLLSTDTVHSVCFNKTEEWPVSSHTDACFYKLVACFRFENIESTFSRGVECSVAGEREDALWKLDVIKEESQNSTTRHNQGACVITKLEVRDRTTICRYNKEET